MDDKWLSMIYSESLKKKKEAFWTQKGPADICPPVCLSEVLMDWLLGRWKTYTRTHTHTQRHTAVFPLSNFSCVKHTDSLTHLDMLMRGTQRKHGET